MQALEDQVEAITDEFNIHNGGPSITDHPLVTTGVSGFMASADKVKLNKLTTAVHETESPADVDALRTAGADADVSRGDHKHRIANARAVAVTGGAFKGTGGTLGASDPGFTDTGSRTSVGRPTNWSSCFVIVNAAVQYSAGSDGVQLNGRVDVDGALGAVVQSGSAAADKGVTQIEPVFAGVTTQTTIDIGVRLWRTNGTGTGTSKYITYTYLLIRAS